MRSQVLGGWYLFFNSILYFLKLIHNKRVTFNYGLWPISWLVWGMRTEVLDSILHISVCSRALNVGLEGMPSQAGSPRRRRNFYCCQVWVPWSWKPKRLSGHKARGEKGADGRGRLKKSLHVIVTPEKEGEGQKEPETAAQLCGRDLAILRGRCCTEMTRGGNLDWVEMVRPQHCPVLSLWPIAP